MDQDKKSRLKILEEKFWQLIEHRHFKKYEKWVSVLIWMGAIYFLSSRSLSFMSPTDIWQFIIRKMAHMFEYAILCLLIYRILSTTEKRHVYWNLFWALAMTVLYAFSDEYHQTFTSGRTGTYRDVIIDSTGAIVTVWLLYLNHKHKQINK
ncbi:VanZ family protein [Candidatus Falkowbacteria bacterium]|nr:VanZ family protein [Candidatus Falkowbacteria bacterium]